MREPWDPEGLEDRAFVKAGNEFVAKSLTCIGIGLRWKDEWNIG